MKFRFVVLPAALLIMGFAQTAFAYDYPGMQLASKAKLTMRQAQAIAEKAYPGTIVEEKLKYALGGSGMRYSFDIVGHHITHEVAVDANTGKVLRNVRDTDGD